MKRKFMLLLTCLFIGYGLVTAQNQTVTGNVISEEDGQPVIGASVLVKGTTLGAITDMNGNFSIPNVPSTAKTLQISFVGMKSQEVAVKPNVKIVLKPDTEILDEVVIVAYGSAKKSSLTGSVEIVKSEQISKVPVNSVDQALQGKAAGVQVTASTGRPGSGANIKIRGTSSISAGNSPLYVIDGVPMSSTDFAALNSSDIEYMSVLKDASATAIYGSRGSNGVILITTKKGKEGKTVFNVKASFGFSTRTLSDSDFTMMNAQEKLTYERQLGSGKGATGGANGGPMTDAEIAAVHNTNWADEILRTGTTQSYEMNISGGNESTKFYVSGQYFDQEAIVPGSYLDRATFRSNLEHKIGEKFKFAVATSVGVSKEGMLRTDRNALNPFNYIFGANPYDAPYNEDGSYNTKMSVGGNRINIFENIDNNPRNITNIKGVGAFSFEWKIWDEIKYMTVAGLDFIQQRNYQYNKPESQLSQILGDPHGYRNESVVQRATWVWTNVLSYEKTFNSVHDVKAIVGMEAQGSNYRSLVAMVSGFPTGKLDAINIGATDKDVEGVETEWKLLSYIASLGYTYDAKYIVDLSLRRDGSSRFGTDTKYGTFWAVGLGWNMERESFLSDVEWLNRLKLRGSIGTSGNNSIGDYAAQGVYGYGSYNGATTAYPGRLPNPDLSWEKSLSTSLGFDASFFDSRLNVVFDVYHRKTTDLLLSTNLSMTSGFSSRIDNVGELANKGYEIAINGDIIRNNDWTVNLNFMISQNKNEIKELYKGNDIMVGWNNIITEGYPISSYKMVRWAGVNPANGDALYYTADGEITNVYNSNDAVILDGKTADPKYFGSFGASVAYKGLELSGDFYFSGGNYIYNHNRFFSESDGAQIGSNMDKSMLYDQWMKPGDITNVPRQSIGNSSVQSTRYLEDGSYLRLRNLTLAYTLPKSLLAPTGIQNCRVFAQALNLFTITGFKGLDPEVGTPNASGTGSSGGVLDYNFPASRTIMFGLEVSF
ncbi:TonB-dependent receptor [Bacteroides sp. 214]|uniref:SusC/RagA family TonB-linked outer membrane protein n=1 Tax=Bacteroides sp. 214 TaxID=2302935 RepID=UPI0013D2F958|nr:TonB-dependent receptor [Bacteroides sp. 214]NDW13850.1 TonB-dependent receptor [Bacteroides sp. 214]